MKIIFYGDEPTRYPDEVVRNLRLKIMGFLNRRDVAFYYAGHNRFEHLAAIEVKRYENAWQPAKKILAATHPGQVWDDFLYDRRIYPVPGRNGQSDQERQAEQKRWLLSEADIICCYFADDHSEAAAFYREAKRLGKTVIKV